MAYPPRHLADLAVQLLAQASDSFTPTTVFSSPNRRGRAGVPPPTQCCKVNLLAPGAAFDNSPFYFGCDADGYTILSPRHPVPPGWPLGKRAKPKPVRLARWLLEVPAGSVTRHACDTPACIRMAHLSVADQADNLADSIRRGRRHRSPLSTTALPAPAGLRSQPCPQAMRRRPRDAYSERDALFCVAGFNSPSKAARKAARQR
jgi:hypothetical protein